MERKERENKEIKEREIKELKIDENEINLSEKERKILKDLEETEYYNKENKALLRKLFLQLPVDNLIEIILVNTTDRPDNISKALDVKNITKEQIKELIEYIIDTVKPEKYLT